MKKIKDEINYLFVDGSNFYASQYELLKYKKIINFEKFTGLIQKSLNIKFSKVLFYCSYSPQPKHPSKTQKMYLKNEALFYKSVKKLNHLEFFKGYRSPASGKEKEVDVKLAVDIVNLAHLDKYDNLYFYSADADFTHALLIAKSLKKNIIILGLANRIPFRFIFLFPTLLFSLEKTKNKIISGSKIKKFITIPSSCIENI